MAELPVIEAWVERELGLRPGSRRVLEGAGRLLRRRLGTHARLPAAGDLEPEVREALIRILTSSHTLFFRDLPQLESIVDTIAARTAVTGRPVKVWSAGCSTGEEPYSVAALCRDRQVPVRITATDVSGPSLELARGGWYPRLTAKRAPTALVERHLELDDEGARIRPELAALVDFARHDLVRDAALPPAGGGFDVILCRNVLIYYRPDIARLVLESLAGALAPGGTLFTAPTDELSCRLPAALVRTASRPAFRRGRDAAPQVPGRPRPPAADYDEALRRQADGDRGGAEGILKRVLEHSPDNYDALLSLAAIMIERREFAGVQPLLQRALGVDPLSPEPTLVEALMLRKQGRVRDALGPLRRSAFLDAEFWPATFLLATTWQRLGEAARSRHEFAHTLRVLGAVEASVAQRHLVGLSGLYIEPSQAIEVCRTHA